MLPMPLTPLSQLPSHHPDFIAIGRMRGRRGGEAAAIFRGRKGFISPETFASHSLKIIGPSISWNHGDSFPATPWADAIPSKRITSRLFIATANLHTSVVTQHLLIFPSSLSSTRVSLIGLCRRLCDCR